MRNLPAVRLLLLALALNLAGCNSSTDKHGTVGGQGTGGAGIGQHLKLMDEACDLALKILADRASGQGVTEVNQKYAPQVAEIDARIAKLPKLTADQEKKIMQAYAGKPRDVELKVGALGEKGQLHETGLLLKLPNYALGETENPK